MSVGIYLSEDDAMMIRDVLLALLGEMILIRDERHTELYVRTLEKLNHSLLVYDAERDIHE